MRQANIDVLLTEESDRGKTTTTQVHKGSSPEGMFQSAFLHRHWQSGRRSPLDEAPATSDGLVLLNHTGPIYLAVLCKREGKGTPVPEWICNLPRGQRTPPENCVSCSSAAASPNSQSSMCGIGKSRRYVTACFVLANATGRPISEIGKRQCFNPTARSRAHDAGEIRAVRLTPFSAEKVDKTKRKPSHRRQGPKSD